LTKTQQLLILIDSDQRRFDMAKLLYRTILTVLFIMSCWASESTQSAQTQGEVPPQQVPTGETVEAKTNTEKLDLVRIRIDRKGRMFWLNGRPIKQVYFPNSFFDRQGNNPLRPGQARMRQRRMWMDRKYMQRKPTAEDLAKYYMYLEAEQISHKQTPTFVEPLQQCINPSLGKSAMDGTKASGKVTRPYLAEYREQVKKYWYREQAKLLALYRIWPSILLAAAVILLLFYACKIMYAHGPPKINWSEVRAKGQKRYKSWQPDWTQWRSGIEPRYNNGLNRLSKKAQQFDRRLYDLTDRAVLTFSDAYLSLVVALSKLPNRLRSLEIKRRFRRLGRAHAETETFKPRRLQDFDPREMQPPALPSWAERAKPPVD
jgi:hypothetical protein